MGAAKYKAKIALAAALSLLTASSVAEAYCRTGAAPTTDCPTAAPGSTGKPIYWASRCAGFTVQAEPTKVAPDLPLLVDQGFGAWQERVCGTGDAAIAPSMRLLVFGARTNLKVGYDQNGPNENVVVVGDIPGGGADGLLALPTVTFSKTTGEILDADLEINAKSDWSKFDLPSILTHESGHLLGLAHSDVADATMNPAAEGTDISDITKRTIAPDDAAGICAIYPPAGTRATAAGSIASTACNLSTGSASTCATTVSGGCSTVPSQNPWEGLAACLLVVGGVLGIRRRASVRTRKA